MAKTKNAFFSIEARGKVGPLIAEQRREGQYVKIHQPIKDRPSEKQKEKRKRYGQAVETWQQLPPDLKEVLNIKGNLIKISGFNLFLKHFTTFGLIATYGTGIYGRDNYG